MELSLIRSLMDKTFYDEHRGAKCPDRLFSKDVRKIKQALDSAMTTYERTVTPDEIEALFMSNNPSMGFGGPSRRFSPTPVTCCRGTT